MKINGINIWIITIKNRNKKKAKNSSGSAMNPIGLKTIIELFQQQQKKKKEPRTTEVKLGKRNIVIDILENPDDGSELPKMSAICQTLEMDVLVRTYLRTGLDRAIGVATPNALIRCCMVGVAEVIRIAAPG